MQNDSVEKSTVTNEDKIMPRPNVSDINNVMKVVKPYIERPFFPQEVASIETNPPKPLNPAEMSSAILIGPTQRSNGQVEEDPTMYNTVINSHPTIITRPILAPQSASLSSFAAQQLANQATQEEMLRATPGAYSIPVQMGAGTNDPTLSGYESPNFIHKNEKVLPVVNGALIPDMQASITTAASDDLQDFTSQLGNSHSKQEKLDILIKGRKKLEKEIETLKLTIQSEIDTILGAKEVAVLMHNLSLKYQAEIQRQNSAVQIADEVTLKKMLKEKLYKEIQGFRTFPSEYQELEKVDQNDIHLIVNSVQQKLS